MSLINLILLIMVGGILAYFTTRVNKKAGAWITVIVSLITLIVLYTYKDLSVVSGQNIFQFKITPYGWFFAMIMTLTYAGASFFNIYWMEKLIYPAAYNFLYLLSLAGTIGLFFSSNLLGIFVFWEIVVWGSMFIIPLGKSRRASVVYYTVSTTGSFAMLFGILFLYVKYGTFNTVAVLNAVAADPLLATGMFFLLVMAGLTKLGIFPFHIWLPLAHGNAPHTFSPVLSGGLVKMGAFIAFLTVAVLPTAKAFGNSWQILGVPYQNYILLILGAISIVVGTLMAIKQDDMKKLIAYSTVSNSGYILIGIALNDSIGMAGGLMHVFNHAMATSAMFLAAAVVAYRTGTTKMSKLGGLIHKMPITFVVYLMAIISLAGIPPMGGFISKWLIFQSLVKHGMVFIAMAAFFGSAGSFLYVFRPLSTVFLGQLLPQYKDVKEAPMLMLIPMIVISALTQFFGIFPTVILKYIGKIEKSVGMIPIKIDGLNIIANNGNLNATWLSLVFTFGFIIALIIFLILPKSRKVGLMDTYTSAEFIYSPELYHYSSNYYAPFERLYEKHPNVEKFLFSIGTRVKDLGDMVSKVFFSFRPAVAILWLVVIISVIFMLGGKA